MKKTATVILSLVMFLGCSAPGTDLTGKPNDLQLASVLDSTTLALNQGKCSTALTQILPLYSSIYSNNDIRLSTAATYGCFAKLNIFQIVGDLVSATDLGGAGFWQFMVKEFASSAAPTDDRIPQSAENGIDAVLAAVDTSVPLVAADWMTTTGYNPQVYHAVNRTKDANTYLTFLSMALMGSLLSRVGVPDASYNRTVAVPWTNPALTKGDGCSFASGLLLFLDGISYLASNAPSQIASVYSTMQTFLDLGLDTACAVGCRLCGLAGSSVTCTTCPANLRDRTSCTGVNTDVNSCAASGLALFANASWTGTP